MKKIFNHWPLIFLFLVWFIFSGQFFLKGLVPFPSDYLVNFFAPWSSYPEFWGPIKNNATPDVISQIYPWKKLVIDIWKSGNIPLWNPYGFSGTPLLANYQSAVLSPLNLVYFILPFIEAWSILILLQPLMAGIFTYLFVRSLKLSKSASVISSLAFMFCGFLITWMMYGTMGYAILFLPLALFAVQKISSTQKWYYSLLLAITIPFSFFSGHFQTSLYFLIFILAYIIFKFLTERNVEAFLLNLLSVFWGLLFSSVQLIPSIELYWSSVRSEIFMKSEVIPWGYLPTFLAPDFFGNPVTRNDWFGHYAEWNAYIGLLPLMLGFYSLRKRNTLTLFFFFFAALVFLLAFQTPILDLLIVLKIPVLSTSAASRIIVLFSFCFAVLAGFGFDNLIADLKNKKLRPVFLWIAFFAFLFLLLWVITSLSLFLPEDKSRISFSNLKLPTILLLGSILVIFLGVFVKVKNMLVIISALLILITAFDVLRFAIKWQPFEPKNLVFPDVPISKFLSAIQDKDRVFGNLGAEASVTYRIPSIEGYDPLYIGRYGEFIRAASDGRFHKGERSVVLLSKNAAFRERVINFLGVKYLVHKVSDNNTVWTYPVWKYPVDQFKIVYEDDFYQIFENQKVFKRAFLVNNIKVRQSEKEILGLILKEGTDLKKEAVLEEDIELAGKGVEIGEAEVREYKPNRISIETSSKGENLLILTDPFYPGWKAYIDGKPSKIQRVDYAFRGVVVPDGKHNVTFLYNPESFKTGLLLAVLGIIGAGAQSFYLRKK
ncbi:MAG: YfhO family protein [bacterium]|nr:YfhO family protein [bacterium]